MSKSKHDSESESSAQAEQRTFEQALNRLEELVRRLEQGNVPLEQSLAEYSEAVELLRVCQGKLDAAQGRIEILSGFNANGEPVTRPLDSQAMTLDEKREARSSRRSANPGTQPPKPVRRVSDMDETGQLF